MFVALLLALAAETAPAPETAAAPEAKPAAKDEMVCHTERVTGSRLPPKKVCRLKSDMDQKRADDQARVRDNQRLFNPNNK
jgi:hypothetical protein